MDSMPTKEHTEFAKKRIRGLYPEQQNVAECRSPTECADPGKRSVDSGVFVLVHALYTAAASLGGDMQLPDRLNISLCRDTLTAILEASHGLSYCLSFIAQLDTDTIAVQGR